MRVSMLRGFPLSVLVALVSVTAGANPVLTVDPGKRRCSFVTAGEPQHGRERL